MTARSPLAEEAMTYSAEWPLAGGLPRGHGNIGHTYDTGEYLTVSPPELGASHSVTWVDVVEPNEGLPPNPETTV